MRRDKLVTETPAEVLRKCGWSRHSHLNLSESLLSQWALPHLSLASTPESGLHRGYVHELRHDALSVPQVGFGPPTGAVRSQGYQVIGSWGALNSVWLKQSIPCVLETIVLKSPRSSDGLVSSKSHLQSHLKQRADGLLVAQGLGIHRDDRRPEQVNGDLYLA